jgi:hypothetical protein
MIGLVFVSHHKFLRNEVETLNYNPKLLKFLIGTNADKDRRTFNRKNAEEFAHEYTPTIFLSDS